MMKFFRKYNRQLLAVFMALLLVVWLGGSALTAMIAPSPDAYVRGKSKLGKISEADLKLAQFETDRILQLGLNWHKPWIGSPPVDHEPLAIFDWILLTREAAQWGTVARQTEVDRFLTSLGWNQDQVYSLATRLDVPPERFYAAIAKYIGVWRTMSQTVARAQVSEAAVRVAAREELEQVRIMAVPVRAGSYMEEAMTFSEEQMQAHFERYREATPVSGIIFGYRLLPRLQFQYIRVDPAEIAENLRIGESTLDDQAREFWRSNRQSDIFRKAPVSEDGNQPAQWSLCETYEDAREIAQGLVRRKLATPKIRNVATWLVEQAQDPWYGMEKGEDGYKVGTEELLSADFFDKIVARLPANLTYGDAVQVVTTEYFALDKLNSARDIGTSFHSAGNTHIQFPQVASQVQGLLPMPTNTGIDTTFFLAIGQPSPLVMYNAREQGFIYRIVDIKQAGPAENLDVVRERVIADMRLLEGYKLAQEMAEKLELTASGMGLKDAYNDMKPELDAIPTNFKTMRYEPEPFGRAKLGSAGSTGDNRTIYIPGVQSVTPEFVDECFELENDPNTFKVATIEVDYAAKIVVVEFLERIPLRENAYAIKRQEIANSLTTAAAAAALREWLTPQRIRDRNEFELVRQ